MLLKQVYHLEKCNLLKTKRNGRFTRMTIGREIILKLTFMRRRLKFNWVWKGCSFHKNNYFTSPYLSLLKNLHTVGFFSKAPANSRFARKSPGTEYFYIRVCETPGVGLFYFSWRVGGGVFTDVYDLFHHLYFATHSTFIFELNLISMNTLLIVYKVSPQYMQYV